MRNFSQDSLNEEWRALRGLILLAEMHDDAAPDEVIDGCTCNRCGSIVLS